MVKIHIQSKYFFKYIILDNFFSDSEINFLNRCNISNQPSDKVSILYQLRIFKDKKIEVKIGGDLSPQAKIIAIHKKYENLFHSILSVLCPAKSKLIDFIEYALVATGKDYKYIIHDDIPAKLLSTVIYLKPEENMGTVIYPCPQYKLANGKIVFPSNGVSIKWKTNRALIFSRIHERTWHSYQGDGKSNRLAFVINVGTDKVKEVMEIENSKEFKESITWVN